MWTRKASIPPGETVLVTTRKGKQWFEIVDAVYHRSRTGAICSTRKIGKMSREVGRRRKPKLLTADEVSLVYAEAVKIEAAGGMTSADELKAVGTEAGFHEYTMETAIERVTSGSVTKADPSGWALLIAVVGLLVVLLAFLM